VVHITCLMHGSLKNNKLVKKEGALWDRAPANLTLTL
jgi:hypothetical protein